AARGAEIPLCLAAVVLAHRRERGQRVPLDVERGAGHSDDYGERIARLTLAVRAVADGLNHWFRVGAVGDGAAKTAARDWLGRGHVDVYESRSSLTSQRSTEARVPGVSDGSICSKIALASFIFCSFSKKPTNMAVFCASSTNSFIPLRSEARVPRGSDRSICSKIALASFIFCSFSKKPTNMAVFCASSTKSFIPVESTPGGGPSDSSTWAIIWSILSGVTSVNLT